MTDVFSPTAVTCFRDINGAIYATADLAIAASIEITIRNFVERRPLYDTLYPAPEDRPFNPALLTKYIQTYRADLLKLLLSIQRNQAQ